jgi:hypothetical protein
MWTKIRRMLAGAVALVAAGISITVALRQSGETEGVSRGEWCAATERLNDESQWYSFYAALPEAVTPPADKIGTCADGICTMAPQGVTECPIVYRYTRGPAVAGWRIWEIRALPSVAGYLRRWVLEGNGRWYESKAQVVSACLQHFTGVQCLQLLGNANKGCWLLDGEFSGDYCRDGYVQRNHGPGDAVPVACPAARIIAPIDCVTSKGAGGELLDVQATFAAEDYEEPRP